jgi:hypothetical protein
VSRTATSRSGQYDNPRVGIFVDARAACDALAEPGSASADSVAAAPAEAPAAPAAAPTVTDPQIAAIVVAANEVDIEAHLTQARQIQSSLQ